MNSPADPSLVALGLTQLEADIYTFLLQESPSTGYRVAKNLGKPAANVYKAIETLEAKGAVEVDDGRTRLCRPVPAAELLDLLERRFKRNRDQAAASLQRLPGPAQDSRVYQINHRDQLFGKCRHMLQTAQRVVLVDLFLQPLDELRPDLERAAARGVAVAVKSYATDGEVAGAQVILEPEHERIRKRWPAQWIVMVSDGAEMLIALLTKDGTRVIQAVWSGSPFLSWNHHSGLSSELAYTALRREMAHGASLETLHRTNAGFEPFMAPEAPGYYRLLRQLGLSPDEADDI